MQGVLSGLRVLELGQVLAGPFAGAIFGDLGAEVIKLERADGGDDARRMGPAFHGEDSLTFQVFNRGKQSVALDLKSEQGRADFERLAASADVFIHNLRPDASLLEIPLRVSILCIDIGACLGALRVFQPAVRVHDFRAEIIVSHGLRFNGRRRGQSNAVAAMSLLRLHDRAETKREDEKRGSSGTHHGKYLRGKKVVANRIRERDRMGETKPVAR